LSGVNRPSWRGWAGWALGALLMPRGWRVLCASAAALAVVFGVLGQELIYSAANAHLDFLDGVYGALSLFVFQPPPLPSNAVGFSTFYQVARFLAPMATLYAVADALVLPGARLQARFARGHVVICGSDPVVLALAEKLGARGEQVVLVTDRDPGPLGHGAAARAITRLVGDPTRPGVLKAAGLTRAERLYILGPATVSNAAVLFAAADVLVSRRRPPLACYVEESDPDVFDALWMLTLRRSRDDRMKIDFFNGGRLGVRALLRDVVGPGEWTPASDAPIAIAGFGLFGQELLVEIARRRASLSSGSLRVAVVDEQASATFARLRERYGVLGRALDVVCHDVAGEEVDLNALVHADGSGAYIEQIFVCYDDEELALRKALATARPPSRRSVVVRVNRNNPLATAFSPDRPSGFGLDALYGDLIVFSELDRLIDPAESPDDRLELIASAIHANYVRLRLDFGEARSDNEALVAWSMLPEKYRSENYDQARDIEEKLRMIGAASARMSADSEPFTFTPEELDLLARAEHERWMRERLDQGWRAGPERDNEALIHPDIKEYDDLSQETKDKDIQAVCLIPELLAAAGYRIVRLGARPA